MTITITNAQVEGGFQRRNTGQRSFFIRIEDPASGALIAEIEMTEAQYMDAITNTHTNELGGTFTLYEQNLGKIGQWHALATVFVPIDMRDEPPVILDKINRCGANLPGEWVHYEDGKNGHRRVDHDGVRCYTSTFHTYVAPGTTVDQLIWDTNDMNADVQFRVLDPNQRIR